MALDLRLNLEQHLQRPIEHLANCVVIDGYSVSKELQFSRWLWRGGFGDRCGDKHINSLGLMNR